MKHKMVKHLKGGLFWRLLILGIIFPSLSYGSEYEGNSTENRQNFGFDLPKMDIQDVEMILDSHFNNDVKKRAQSLSDWGNLVNYLNNVVEWYNSRFHANTGLTDTNISARYPKSDKFTKAIKKKLQLKKWDGYGELLSSFNEFYGGYFQNEDLENIFEDILLRRTVRFTMMLGYFNLFGTFKFENKNVLVGSKHLTKTLKQVWEDWVYPCFLIGGSISSYMGEMPQDCHFSCYMRISCEESAETLQFFERLLKYQHKNLHSVYDENGLLKIFPGMSYLPIRYLALFNISTDEFFKAARKVQLEGNFGDEKEWDESSLLNMSIFEFIRNEIIGDADVPIKSVYESILEKVKLSPALKAILSVDKGAARDICDICYTCDDVLLIHSENKNCCRQCIFDHILKKSSDGNIPTDPWNDLIPHSFFSSEKQLPDLVTHELIRRRNHYLGLAKKDLLCCPNSSCENVFHTRELSSNAGDPPRFCLWCSVPICNGCRDVKRPKCCEANSTQNVLGDLDNNTDAINCPICKQLYFKNQGCRFVKCKREDCKTPFDTKSGKIWTKKFAETEGKGKYIDEALTEEEVEFRFTLFGIEKE